MRNRIIAIVVVVALIPCCLAVSANAAYTETCWINLLDYSSTDLHDGGNIPFVFDLPGETTLYQVDFIIQTGDSSISPYIKVLGTNHYLNVSQLGFVNKDTYCYRVYGSVPLHGYHSLTFYPGSDSWVTILSAKASQINTNSFDAAATGVVRFSDPLYDSNFSINSNLNKVFATPILPANTAKDFRAFVELPDWKKFDSYSLLFEAYCSNITSVSAYQGSSAIPIEISYINSSTFVEDPYIFTVRIDLQDCIPESIDVPVIVFTGNCYDSTYGANGFAINRCQGEILISDVDPELNFLQRIKLSIDGFWNDVGTWFQQQISVVSSWGQNIVNSIASWGQNIVDAIINPDGSSELSEAGDDLGQSAGDLNAAGDVLGSIDQPDVNTGDLIGGFTNFDTGGLRILSCLTSNAQVTQMMIVVFTFCLAGYIFFGKKG